MIGCSDKPISEQFVNLQELFPLMLNVRARVFSSFFDVRLLVFRDTL